MHNGSRLKGKETKANDFSLCYSVPSFEKLFLNGYFSKIEKLLSNSLLMN